MIDWGQNLKRLFDLVASFSGLILASPIIFAFTILVFLQDFRFPFYVPQRVGRNGRIFKMVKLRSMKTGADKSGVLSTSNNDPRITRTGRLIRKYKLDELTQLWNVLWGSMSIIGPRPQVQRDVNLYTAEEKRLLSVRPGLTDFSSIVFADEGAILADAEDPDLRYNQLIRPWKSRLGLFYIDHQSLWLDIRLIGWTAVALISRRVALEGIAKELQALGAPGDLLEVARRDSSLVPYPPPGSDEIVSSRPVTVESAFSA